MNANQSSRYATVAGGSIKCFGGIRTPDVSVNGWAGHIIQDSSASPWDGTPEDHFVNTLLSPQLIYVSIVCTDGSFWDFLKPKLSERIDHALQFSIEWTSANAWAHSFWELQCMVNSLSHIKKVLQSLQLNCLSLVPFTVSANTQFRLHTLSGFVTKRLKT